MVSATSRPVQCSVLSYNLKYHQAYQDVLTLVDEYDPDIICLQECFVDELPAEISGHILAARTAVGWLGMAIYVRKNRFQVLHEHSVSLPLSTFEKIFHKDRTRLLVAELRETAHGLPFIAASFHATQLVTLNRLRYKQTMIALRKLRGIDNRAGSILIGDYNHPFPRQKLRAIVRQAGFKLLVAAEHTFRLARFKAILDFASVRNVTATDITVLPFALSDHAPILVTMELHEN